MFYYGESSNLGMKVRWSWKDFFCTVLYVYLIETLFESYVSL